MIWSRMLPVGVVLAMLASIAHAQQQPAPGKKATPCHFSSDRFSTDTVPGGGQVTFLAGNVIIRCPERGIVVRGDSAERRPDGDHMIGDVVVKTVDGRTLRSPHVTFNQLTHQISSDTSYTLSRGKDTQTGVGFTSDQAFVKFGCKSQCKGNASLFLPER
jgi:hypothetical protein